MTTLMSSASFKTFYKILCVDWGLPQFGFILPSRTNFMCNHYFTKIGIIPETSSKRRHLSYSNTLHARFSTWFKLADFLNTYVGILARIRESTNWKLEERWTYVIIHQTFLKATIFTVWSVRIQSFSGPHFPALGLNTEIYRVNLHIQSECGKIRIRKTPNTDIFYAVIIKIWMHFSHVALQYFKEMLRRF